MRQGIRTVVALETQDMEEAIVKARKLQEQPMLLAPEEARLEVKGFIEYKLKHNEYSRFSAENKSLTLYRFVKGQGARKLDQITTAHVQKFYESEIERVTESTAQGYILTIRSFFNYLVGERKVLRSNPATTVKMKEWDYGHRVKFCTPEDRDLLLNGLTTVPTAILLPETVAMLGFVLHAGFESGLRRNEIIEARPEWFGLKMKSMRVQQTDTFVPKDREARPIPLTDSFIRFLKNYPFSGKWCIAPEVERGKSRYRYDFISPFKKYLAYLGQKTGKDFSWVTPHVMRHTFASILIQNGESLTKVSIWMGDDPRVTRRHYDAASPDPLTIFVSSQGTDVIEGLKLADTIGLMRSPVTAVALGLVEGAGILLLAMATKRIVYPSAILSTAGLWDLPFLHPTVRPGMGLHRASRTGDRLDLQVADRMRELVVNSGGKLPSFLADPDAEPQLFDASAAIRVGLADAIIDGPLRLLKKPKINLHAKPGNYPQL